MGAAVSIRLLGYKSEKIIAVTWGIGLRNETWGGDFKEDKSYSEKGRGLCTRLAVAFYVADMSDFAYSYVCSDCCALLAFCRLFWRREPYRDRGGSFTE